MSDDRFTADDYRIAKLVGTQRCHMHTFVAISDCGCCPDPTIWAQEAMTTYCNVIGKPGLKDQVA